MNLFSFKTATGKNPDLYQEASKQYFNTNCGHVGLYSFLDNNFSTMYLFLQLSLQQKQAPE